MEQKIKFMTQLTYTIFGKKYKSGSMIGYNGGGVIWAGLIDNADINFIKLEELDLEYFGNVLNKKSDTKGIVKETTDWLVDVGAIGEEEIQQEIESLLEEVKELKQL